jgi:chitodextrinase
MTPVDVTAAASGSSALMNSGNATTTSANDLIFGAGVSDNMVTSAGSGFTARDSAFGNITEDRIAGPAGSYGATAAHNGRKWAMQMVAFRAASADATPPTAPTLLSAIPLSPSQINLAWTASTDPDNASAQLTYTVYRNAVRIGATTAGTISWQDTGLAASTTYTYAVSAQDPAGNSSPQSTGVQATTAASLPGITSFTASPASIVPGQTATLSWTVSNATSLTINSGVGTVTSLPSTAVHPAATTTYILTASNSAGSATAQVVVTVSTDTTAPSVPTLTAVGVSASQVNLSWTVSTDNVGVLGYRVYQNGAQAGQTSATTFSATALNANSLYTYTVSAYDAAGNNSALSTPASATTFASDAQAPTVSITSPANNQTISGSGGIFT